MLDTRYLYQPHGPGTAYLFRMRTPAALVGRPNPRTGKPYKGEIKEGKEAVEAKRQGRAASVNPYIPKPIQGPDYASALVGIVGAGIDYYRPKE